MSVLSGSILRHGITITAAAIFGFSATDANARQWPSGNVSMFFDFVPERDGTVELRTRVFVEKKLEPKPYMRINLSGFAEGLLARRPVPGFTGIPRKERVTDAIVRVHDAYLQLTNRRADLLVGHARVVWGRLDEIQPTDVVNPLDVSRFFFEGRSEARLPVAVVRTRVFLSDDSTLEGVYVPVFRRGRFDQLDEATSPFDLTAAVGRDIVVCLAIGCPTLPPRIERQTPASTASSAQGGLRFSTTTGRVDWSLAAYRGFEHFGLFMFDVTSAGFPSPDGDSTTPNPVRINETYPRFTMFGGDFEAVSGPWGVRGEVAVFPEDNFQAPNLAVVTGRSLDAGFGVDRRAGEYTVSATVLIHSESYDAARGTGRDTDGRSDVSLVASADRTFAREKYRLRTFGLFNASEASGFLRGIGFITLRDNLVLEGSIGWFIGVGPDLVGRFSRNDFGYARLNYHF
jgi:hypothetical protein